MNARDCHYLTLIANELGGPQWTSAGARQELLEDAKRIYMNGKHALVEPFDALNFIYTFEDQPVIDETLGHRVTYPHGTLCLMTDPEGIGPTGFAMIDINQNFVYDKENQFLDPTDWRACNAQIYKLLAHALKHQCEKLHSDSSTGVTSLLYPLTVHVERSTWQRMPHHCRSVISHMRCPCCNRRVRHIYTKCYWPTPLESKRPTPIAVPAIEWPLSKPLCKPILRRSVKVDDVAAAAQRRPKRCIEYGTAEMPPLKHGRGSVE